MITVIYGLTGAGKTFLMTQLIYNDWKNGAMLNVNYPIYFSENNDNIKRWHQLDETYNLTQGIIAIDEGQKLFDARRWASLPVGFAEKIAQHRKHHLDIYTTTQDLGNIDLRVRQNIHEVYHCQSVARFPRNDRVKPVLQIIKVTRKIRVMDNNTNRITWKNIGTKKLYLSRYWTRELYNTYADIGFERYLCKIKAIKKAPLGKRNWRVKLVSRDLLNRGKVRL